jgi:hypothetical protein
MHKEVSLLYSIIPDGAPVCMPSQQAYLSDIMLSALQDRLRAEADKALQREIGAEARGEPDPPENAAAIDADTWAAHLLG